MGYAARSYHDWMGAKGSSSAVTSDVTDSPLRSLTSKGYDLKFVSHAGAIFAGDFPGALNEIAEVLDPVRLPITEIIGSGDGETRFTQRLRRALALRGWKKHHFEIAKTVDGVPPESTSHEVDHMKRFPAGVVRMRCGKP